MGNSEIFQSSGNIGIGTTNPKANLEVDGTVKVGANGLIFSEILEMSGNTDYLADTTYIDYPPGYNWEHTHILACEVLLDFAPQETPFWGPIGVYGSGSGDIYVRLRESHIEIKHQSIWNTKKYRLVLMKFP